MTKRFTINSTKVLHLLSGGLDSTVLLSDLLFQKRDVRCIGFDYGQTHRRELDAARKITKKLSVPFEVISLPGIFGGSSLVGCDGGVVVPNRNMVLLSIAAAIAEADGHEVITIGANKDDFAGFPDCRSAFVTSMNHCLRAARLKVRVHAPYLEIAKRDLAALGRRLGAPLEDTWSCYAGGDTPCGICDACLKRATALE